MKKICGILLSLLMVVMTLSACSSSTKSSSSDTSASNTSTASSQATEMTQEQLIAAAKAEGTLNVYGVHSYLKKSAEAFATKYGITVNFTQLGETELIQKATAECAAKANGADLLYCQDAARIEAELVNPGYVYEWSSERLGKLTGDTNMSMSVFEYSSKAFIYNNENSGSTPYLTNIWQITDPKNANHFSMKDPNAEGVNFNFLTMLTSPTVAAKLADAYKAYYGKDIKLTTENAGYEWIKGVYGNGVQLGTSDTKISEAVGAKGQSATWIGYFVEQRLSTAAEKNLALAMNSEMTPAVGFYYPIRSIILNNAKQKNAAKLFVEYMLSEEGWSFFKGNLGEYSANTNLSYAGDISFAKWKTIAIGEDMDYVYKNRANLEDFLGSLK